MTETLLSTLGTTPIAGEKPAGIDARYEASYGNILEEIEKLSFSEKNTPISWPTVEENAVFILSQQSKDLQVAAYLAVALCHTKNIQGMLDGIHILHGLLENFWENGWPVLKRLRGRINAIDWWHERTATFLTTFAANDAKASPLSTDFYTELRTSLTQLDEMINQRMPDASALHDLLALVRKLPVIAPPENTADNNSHTSYDTPQETPSNTSVPSTGAGALASVTSNNTTSTSTSSYTGDAHDSTALYQYILTNAKTYIAAARPTEAHNARFWQLSRMTVWDEIQHLPPAEKNRTFIPTPDMTLLKHAQQSASQGDNDTRHTMLFAVEDFFYTAPLCLDAQACIYALLQALNHHAAALCIKEECARFVQRLPEIAHLAFEDGTPFMSATTATWLQSDTETNITTTTVKNNNTGGNSNNSADTAVNRLYTQAQTLAQQDSLAAALHFLDSTKSPSQVDIVCARICQIRLLCAHNNSDIAMPLAQVLFHEYTEYRMDTWDMTLSLTALTAMREAFLLNPEQYAKELQHIYTCIVRIAPAQLVS